MQELVAGILPHDFGPYTDHQRAPLTRLGDRFLGSSGHYSGIRYFMTENLTR